MGRAVLTTVFKYLSAGGSNHPQGNRVANAAPSLPLGAEQRAHQPGQHGHLPADGAVGGFETRSNGVGSGLVPFRGFVERALWPWTAPVNPHGPVVFRRRIL